MMGLSLVELHDEIERYHNDHTIYHPIYASHVHCARVMHILCDTKINAFACS